MAETKTDAVKAFDAFVETYQVKYEKAADCLTKDRDALLAFYDFPAEPRTMGPVDTTAYVGWVIYGCTGPSATRQVNLNKRTPAPGTRAGLPSDPSPSDRMTMCWTCSVDAFRRGFRPAARTTHRRSCGLG